MAPPFVLVQPEHRELNGGDLLAQSLKHLGVQVAFGLHGGHLDAFLMGAHDAGIRLVDTRHETVAVQAAEGYSKVRLADAADDAPPVGVCFVTANSGFCNSIPGLATAYADRSAVLCITSSAPMCDAETNVLQGFHDQVVLSRPMTKFAHRVTHVEEIPRLVAHGFRTASSGTPGPVVLDFPIEVLFSPVQQSRISWGSLGSLQPYPPGPHPRAVDKAVEMLQASKRPVIVTGTGARLLRGHAAFAALLDQTQIPVFNSNKFSSPLPFDHPLRAGTAALLSALTKTGSASPDLVMLLGCRTGMFLGSRSAPCIPSVDDAKYIQIDIDGSEIGRVQEIDLGIVSDVRPAVESLAAVAVQTGYRTDPEWVRQACSLKTLPSPFESEPPNTDAGRIHPYHAAKRVLAALEPGAIVCVDGGESASWAVQLLEAARSELVVFACGYLGFLGNGWGYALGAAVADPRRQVVNLQGDGSAGFHLAELDTYARLGCRVLTVVFNNCMWGMSRSGQDLIYGAATPARLVSALSPRASYAAAAAALGIDAAECHDSANAIREAVQRLTTQRGPALLEVFTTSTPVHPGTVAMVGSSTDTTQVVVPYYDKVPRPSFAS